MACILITHGIPLEGFFVRDVHRVIMPPPLQAFTEEELMQHIPHADAVVAVGKLPAHVIRAGKSLKLIANYGAGYDSVDIAAAAECGIPVTNIPDTVTQSTAELAVGLLLAVSRRIGEMNLRLRSETAPSLFGTGRNMGQNLQGQTLGVIGCGRIGRRVMALAQAFGMRVIFHDSAVLGSMPLSQLLEEADAVSLHCPLTENTRHIINAHAFAQMKRGAILINTARGGVVDYDALEKALQNGTLSGAGLDVFPDEPNIPEALLQHKNVVCTPHIGANTHQTRCAMAQACAQQISDVFAGKRPQGIVNGL